MAAMVVLLPAQACRPCYDVFFARGETTSGFSVTDATRSSPTPVAAYATLEDLRGGERQYTVIAHDTRSGGDNLMVTLNGFETPAGDRIGVTVSIPVSAGAGDVYQVTRAFAAPERDQWAFRPASAVGQADIAFSRSQYISPGNYSFHYVANTASGTVRVLRRQPGILELSVDVLVGGGTGAAYRVVGPILLTAGRRREVCPSIS